MRDSLYKDSRGVEFCELMQRMRARGYKPADVARLCHLSKAAVSSYLSGAKTPGIRTLMIFREIEARAAGKTSASASDARPIPPLLAELQKLEASYPEEFEAVATLVRTLLGTVGARRADEGPKAAAPPPAFAEALTLLDKAGKIADAELAAEDAATPPGKSPATTAPKSPPPSAASSRARKRSAP